MNGLLLAGAITGLVLGFISYRLSNSHTLTQWLYSLSTAGKLFLSLVLSFFCMLAVAAPAISFFSELLGIDSSFVWGFFAVSLFSLPTLMIAAIIYYKISFYGKDGFIEFLDLIIGPVVAAAIGFSLAYFFLGNSDPSQAFSFDRGLYATSNLVIGYIIGAFSAVITFISKLVFSRIL